MPQLKGLLRYEEGRNYPKGYRAVNTAVVSYPDGPFTSAIVIDAGSNDGVQVDSPVVNGGGLVGIVTSVFPSTATVKLLTARQLGRRARPRTGVRGIVHRGPGGTLILDQVKKQQVVKPGDTIVTDGTSNARYPDLYPYGIPIGKVPPHGVGVTDTATFLQVQVQPFTDVASLDSVAALVRTSRGR